MRMNDFWEYLRSHAARSRAWRLPGGADPLGKIGFGKTLLLALCVYIGYVIGRIIDDREWFYRMLEKILPRKEE